MTREFIKSVAARLLPWGKTVAPGTTSGRTGPADMAALAHWVSRARERHFLSTEVAASSINWLVEHMPESVEATISAADKVLEHRFSLLGASDFIPNDPDHLMAPDGYRPIDWRLDPVSGLRFPTGFPASAWNMQTMRPGNADIKLPWELARCQHWVVLGQAWRLTGDAKFAREVANELTDFMGANPVGTGVNWLCTMDVAIRAANWAIALGLIKDCDAIEESFWPAAWNHLFAHGHFIRDNLEDKYEVTSNHFLSNVVGLTYVAATFRDLPEGKEWITWCVEMLEREIDVQVLDDGADFESSIPYHRLVTELFLGGFAVAEHAGHDLSENYRKKLKSMVEYLLAVSRPDRLMPQVGDADDGRLHIFTDFGAWNPQDARHVFAPASALLDEPRWARYAGEKGLWEAAWWGVDPQGLTVGELPPPDCTRLFKRAGHAVSRKRGNYLLITNAEVGTRGFGNHKHNDQLGFEFHCNGVPLIVDAGSYVYTSDPALRNRYRGTGMHNTVMVDAVEQNEINPEWLFRMFEKGHPEHLEFSVHDSVARYRGRHKGYTRLSEPVIHERLFEHDTGSGNLTIVDRFEGAGKHDVSWHFHLAPGVHAEQATGGFRLVAGNKAFRLQCPTELACEIGAVAYSPSYGVEISCEAVDCNAVIDVSMPATWSFILSSEQART